MKKFFVITLGLSLFLFADFSRNIGVVTDSTTSLQWQDEYNSNGSSIKISTWIDAIDYCEALILGANTDWRLPNKKELLSIVDYGLYNPSINSYFDNTSVFHNYWSSTSSAGIADYAWSVDFFYGFTYERSKSSATGAVRCVRAGQ